MRFTAIERDAEDVDEVFVPLSVIYKRVSLSLQ
jgi:hypothetical protein